MADDPSPWTQATALTERDHWLIAISRSRSYQFLEQWGREITVEELERYIRGQEEKTGNAPPSR